MCSRAAKYSQLVAIASTNIIFERLGHLEYTATASKSSRACQDPATSDATTAGDFNNNTQSKEGKRVPCLANGV